jgi:hypothetical protein
MKVSKSRFSKAAIAAAVLLGLTFTLIPQTSSAADVVLDQFTEEYQESKVKLTVRKIKESDGTVRVEARDREGRVVDRAKVAAAEERLRNERLGKLDRKLAKRVGDARPNDRIPVSIWVKTANALPNDRSVGLQRHLQAIEDATRGAKTAVLDAVRKGGAQRASAAQYGPAVFADMTPGEIRRMQKHPQVGAIYGQTDYSLNNDDGGTTEGAQISWQAGNLGAGTSSRPVVHEPDGVSDYNPFLANSTHPVVFWCSSVSSACPQGKQINTTAYGTHASQVAGVIASTHAQHRGLAPNAQMVVSANTQDFTDAKLVAAYEWARGNGGDPVNMSWGATCPDGQQNFMSRYVDWAVRNLWSTFTISSGNTRGCASRDLQVSAPGVAWSGITVGAINDGNTGAWGNDVMSSFSRYENPDFAPGMEKPEVVAVGQNRVTTTDSGLSTGSNGTSFSAPAVAGQVTQMLSRRPSQNIWPETNKAAVLASAFHDVTGGFANRSQDGVGAIVAGVSDTIYRNGRFANYSIAADSAIGATVNSTTINLTAGQVVRASSVWTSWSRGGAGPDTLGADIDMCLIRNDTGANVGCSASVSNAWELVEATAPVTGSYTIRSYVYSKEAGWPGSYAGIAWGVRSNPTVCSGAVAVPATGATFSGQSTANGGTYIDSYSGWATEQTGREKLYRLTLTATRDITVTDNNALANVHIIRLSACSESSFTVTTLANGTSSATVDNAPAGIYYAVLDSSASATALSNVTVGVSVAGP